MERSLQLDPGNLASRQMLADFLAHDGRLEEAIAGYRALVAAEPDAPQLVAFCLKGQPAAVDVPCTVKAPPKERSLIEAIDKAVERHDRAARSSSTQS